MGFVRRRFEAWLATSSSPVAQGLREGLEVAKLPAKERRRRNRAFEARVRQTIATQSRARRERR